MLRSACRPQRIVSTLLYRCFLKAACALLFRTNAGHHLNMIRVSIIHVCIYMSSEIRPHIRLHRF